MEERWNSWRPNGAGETVFGNFSPGRSRYRIRGYRGAHADRGRQSDGTTEGTQELVDPSGVGFGSREISGAQWRGEIYFGGVGYTEDGSKSALWKTDGTSAGTKLVAVMEAEPGGFYANESLGVFFAGYTRENGSEPWITQGTAETTFRLKDICEGPVSSDPGEVIAWSDPEGNHPTRFFFRAYSPDAGAELWESDGTTEGTIQTLDIAPGAASGGPYKLTPAKSGFYFNAATEEYGTELWFYKISGGNKAARLADLNPGYLSSSPYALQLLPVSGKLIFSADGPEGEELWMAGDSPGDVECLRDIYEGPLDSEPYHPTSVGNYVVFSAKEPIHGRELWCTDGGKVELLCDIYEDQIKNPSSTPESLTPFGDRLLFVADDIEHGRELWIVGPGDSGPTLLKDIYPGRLGSEPKHLTVVGDLVYFAAEAPEIGTELFVSDGTTAGTALALDIHPDAAGSSGPKHLTAWNGALIFSAYRPYEGEELWGVLPGKRPYIIANIFPGKESSFPKNFVVWKDYVYFQADDGTHGIELWRTDGTEKGTVMVRDIVEIPYEKFSYGELQVQEDRLYFSAYTPEKGQELWVFRDLEKGPRLVEDIAVSAPVRMERRHSAVIR